MTAPTTAPQETLVTAPAPEKQSPTAPAEGVGIAAITGTVVTVSSTAFDVTEQPIELLTTTSYVPASSCTGAVIVSVAVVTLLNGAIFVKFIPFFRH